MTRAATGDEPAIGWLFGIAGKLVTTAAFRVIDEYEISPTGLSVLMILCLEDGLKSTEVAARISCTPATLTSVATTLERAGHLRRQVSGTDRRVVELHITRTGRRRAELVRDKLDAWYREMFSFLSTKDEQVVRPFLTETIARFSTPT